jgi:hypothetical protein
VQENQRIAVTAGAPGAPPLSQLPGVTASGRSTTAGSPSMPGAPPAGSAGSTVAEAGASAVTDPAALVAVARPTMTAPWSARVTV